MSEGRSLNLFGRLLRNWRKSRGWTLEQLAARLSQEGFEYDPSTLGKYERKERFPDGNFLANMTCVGLDIEHAADWAITIGKEAGIDMHMAFRKAKQNLRCKSDG